LLWQRDHLLDPLRHLKRMDIPRGLKRIAALRRPPVMLEIVLPSPQRRRAHGPRVSMAAEDAGFAD
jgi:hypothetical protein